MAETESFLYISTHEKSKIPFSYMLYAYSVKRAYRGTKPNLNLNMSFNGHSQVLRAVPICLVCPAGSAAEATAPFTVVCREYKACWLVCGPIFENSLGRLMLIPIFLLTLQTSSSKSCSKVDNPCERDVLEGGLISCSKVELAPSTFVASPGCLNRLT